MDEISYQCWICPYCFDDHMSDGPCKVEDLRAQIDKLRVEKKWRCRGCGLVGDFLAEPEETRTP